MMNTYTEILEQIISEMKTALVRNNDDVIGSDYRQWLDFLRQVHPESTLLKSESDRQILPVQNARDDPSDNGLKIFYDLREVIRLAATNNHPTWYIQPHFTGSISEFIYKNDELQNAQAISGVPKVIERFNGKIHGVWLDEQTFIAHDTDIKTDFAQKMEVLKNAGFTTPDFALFPTDKLRTMHVNKLETSLINFISTAREKWAQVDGAVIVSDTPLLADSNRIIFKLHNLS